MIIDENRRECQAVVAAGRLAFFDSDKNGKVGEKRRWRREDFDACAVSSRQGIDWEFVLISRAMKDRNFKTPRVTEAGGYITDCKRA
jgi:hypothetical protein